MPISIDEDNLKQGLLGVVVALVEIIKEVLERQAIRRMERGDLEDEEIERLSIALADLNEALENIKKENGIEDAVKSVRDGLDEVADKVIDKFLNPRRWAEEVR
ncbi:MAG: gas vesicle protein K [Thaumarchaeota archaeon]|nr:gas vesicle protein K [Nitrososphaerota archaeon]